MDRGAYPKPIPPNTTQEARWFDYLYYGYGRDTLWRWARQMRLFRFIKAYGGHAGDEDHIAVAFPAETEAEILELFNTLGLPVRRYGPDTPQPQAGVRYTGEEYHRFPQLIYAHPSIGQPGRTTLAGEPVYASVNRGQLEISVLSGADPALWRLTDATVASALRVEAFLTPFASRLLDPPQDNDHCICPKYYPLFWEHDPPPA